MPLNETALREEFIKSGMVMHTISVGDLWTIISFTADNRKLSLTWLSSCTISIAERALMVAKFAAEFDAAMRSALVTYTSIATCPISDDKQAVCVRFDVHDNNFSITVSLPDANAAVQVAERIKAINASYKPDVPRTIQEQFLEHAQIVKLTYMKMSVHGEIVRVLVPTKAGPRWSDTEVGMGLRHAAETAKRVQDGREDESPDVLRTQEEPAAAPVTEEQPKPARTGRRKPSET